MWPVPVNSHTTVMHIVKTVPGDMVALFYDIDLVTGNRQLSRIDRTSETSAHNEKFGHSLILSDMRKRLEDTRDRQNDILA